MAINEKNQSEELEQNVPQDEEILNEDLNEEEIKGSWSIWKGMVITDEFLPEASFLYTAVVQSLDGTEIKLPKKFDANVVSQFIS